MAERRMMSKSIIDTDLFLEMPQTTQNLYFHLLLRADDDGFIKNPNRLMRMIGCSNDDIKLLIAKQYIIAFESGVIVIKHWRLHNYIQSDRYKKSDVAEFSQLALHNKVYELKNTVNNSAGEECIQSVYGMYPQIRLDKTRLDKTREDKSKEKRGKKANAFIPPTLDELEAYIREKDLNLDAKQFFEYFNEGNWIDSNGKKVRSWKQKAIVWSNRGNSTRSYQKDARKEVDWANEPDHL